LVPSTSSLKHAASVNLVSSNVQHKINLQLVNLKNLMRHVTSSSRGLQSHLLLTRNLRITCTHIWGQLQ
jgi:hypothetical protein